MDLEVLSVDRLPDILSNNDIDIAAITAPKEAVKDIIDVIAKSKVRAVWNFSPMDLEVPKGIVVENVHLLDSLMHLTYNLTEYDCK